MKRKSFIFLVVLIFMIVFSLSAVSADDLQTTDSGEVSGDVDIATANPFTTSGELTYDIPADAKEIKNADVYVNVYSGSAENTYGLNANVSLKTENGENQIASEGLWINNGTKDGTVYPVNDHTDKCYSDYQMRYDITDSLKGLNGSSITVKVDTFKMDGKEFDGRIKLIALVLAYDDGDNDVVSYWVDSNQKWTKTNFTTTFATANVKNIISADLTNIALSSANGNFTLNGEPLGEPDTHTPGSTYQYSYWNVTDKIKEGSDTELLSAYAGNSPYGSLKNVLTVLKVKSELVADVSFNTEYTSVPTCYAGTNNTLTVKANSNKAGKYLVELIADGNVVNSTEVELDGVNEATLLLTDPTIRPIDETTVNGAENAKVTYAVNVKLNDEIIVSANKTVPVLYNGYLGCDMEYNLTAFENFFEYFSGEFVVDIQDAGTYLGASAMNRTDVWTVNLNEGSEIAGAILIIPYNWFNTKLYNETGDMFTVTFNGNAIVPGSHYRDQGNLGNYGGYGYGALFYEVTNILNVSGDNTLVLNKNNSTPAVYPSILAYWTNNPRGNFKELHYVLGADLLSNDYNKAGRVVKTDTGMGVLIDEFANTTLYVLAAGAQKGEGNIIFNEHEYADVWSGTDKSTELVTLDVSEFFSENNYISFVATGSTILALPQFIVADAGYYYVIDDVKTEYTSVPCIYAGTNNTFTFTATTNLPGEYDVSLFVFEEGIVNEIHANLTNGTNTLQITDPTIRPINETTVNGANNTLIHYGIDICIMDNYVYTYSVTVPVLYNGNFGKDLEYNASYIEDIEVYPVTGGVEVQTQDVSTYMSAGALNRTDIFNIELDNASSLEKAFVYVAYNWDKTGVNGPVFNVTFNGNAITPKSSYRDQSNLGNYGKYGYGLFIYDVTDLAQAGDNTLFISKESGLTAVYPSNFIYLYNTEESGLLTTVYMANGADLLSNSNNNAGRIVKTTATIPDVTVGVTNASLYVFAASAQKGEGNIIFNGNADVDVWNGTSNTFDTYVTDITENLAALNEIEFVATGSTILALNQMIVTETIVKLVPNVIIEVPSEVKAGENVTVTVSIPDAMGEIYVLADKEPLMLPLDANGAASFIMSNVSAGVHGVGVFYPGDAKHTLGVGLKFFDAIEEPVISVQSKFTDIVINDDLNISFVLADESGLPIANASVIYIINGTANTTVITAADGSFIVPAVSGAEIEIIYAGDVGILGTDTKLTVNVPVAPVVVKVESMFNITGGELVIRGYAIDTKAGEEGIYYATELLDANGNPIGGAKIKFAVNSKVYNRTTYQNGSFAPYKLNMLRAGVYTMAFYFAETDKYTSAFASVSVNLEKKPITIKASSKSYKGSVKTKKYTVSLSTIVGSSHDGKAYLSPKKVTLLVNGKEYTGKTNSDGKVTFTITNLSIKAKYKAKISYAGDNTYESATKTVTLTVK